MKSFIKRNIFSIFLFFITLFIFIVNYKPGTYLIGWDNLFPEFNFWLNIKRDFFAIWQQYRGLGLVDGMSHASLIIQDIERLFLSIFLSTDLIRWMYIFFLLFFGGLGMMKLISKLTNNYGFIPFFGALFYMFNLGSIIQFYLPLEVFIVHFAFLPWLILFVHSFLQTGKKRDLLLFSIFSLLASPQAHVPTVFIAFCMAMFIVIVVDIFLSKLINFKRAFLILIFLFLTNAFWLVPFAVTNISNANIVANTKAFQMASNDIFYRNNKYGNFTNVALIKGFPLEFKHLDFKTGRSHTMMWPWVNHIKTPFFYIPAWIFFLLTVLGFYESFKNKNKKLLPFAAIFLFSFFMLGTDIPIINLLSQTLRKYIPLFNIIFRFTFTKFSIIYAFSYSILLAIGLSQLWKIIINNKQIALVRNMLFLLVACLIISYSLPAFQGYFLYENLAVKIPKEYFQVFDFFNKQNHDERVAVLPIPWYWAWVQPKWGTINSGFIWYGIPQPITDLAFIPWGKENENFYWELEKAVYTKDSTLLKKILNKYDISWIYLDKNIVNNSGKKITYEDYEQLLAETSGVNLAQKFNFISIYRVDTNKLNSFTTVKFNLPSIGPEYEYNDYDQAYCDYGDYLSDQNAQIYYPFRSLFSGKSPKDIEFIVSEDNNNLYFNATVPVKTLDWKIEKNNPFDQEFVLYDKKNNPKKYVPQILIHDNVLTVVIDKKITQVYQSKNNSIFLNQKNNACDKNPTGKALLQRVEDSLILTSADSHNCIKAELPEVSLRYGYLFNIKTKNDSKRGFFVNFNNKTTKKNDLETYLDNDGKDHNYYLISSPRGYYDRGYTVFFNNISEGQEVVTNTLKEVTAYQIPYYFLKNLKLINPNKIEKSSIFYLSQSFHPGWIAIADGKILEHVKVNNWANGWLLNEQLTTNHQSPVTIIFWPQYLEYLGFALLIIAFLIIIFKYDTTLSPPNP
jgi:hypothetical protein